VGTSSNDTIYGLEGNDRIITDDGDDIVDAGDGDFDVDCLLLLLIGPKIFISVEIL
jgi:hypothetical protein